ncbi:SagB/ThcOx family dehydrogenase [Candidatus Xianfuyuplasma coldseepsis]|uniref:SagB/ThcOx family dehydrogenase n=1 Tax=Candidatus Xianfuyuplasma coldseepsis TaxID=2782163 RepID=A0A7L7KS58_9MOLU|nr:SagB/ThcOx family dehydrogenase [Xianfuyuplasma coldseepsis]QMS85651.1 SagB/ThcOx family dehydrogenase [Xianfuyuplasma coldseepsis]
MKHSVSETIRNNRSAIKPSWPELRSIKTPRDLGEQRPEQFKPQLPNTDIVQLLHEFPDITQKTLMECIQNRRSLRSYSETSLTLEEVSYLLYETARVDNFKPGVTFRTIPTGGATNAMETYVYIHHVEGIKQGLYHYLQVDHKLQLLDQEKDIATRVNDALFHQLRGASIVVFMTAIPARSEYKYSFCAHKMIAMEAGHAGQNCSLAAEVIDAGACCIAAYHQDLMDELLQVDGQEEFATYALTIGKKK